MASWVGLLNVTAGTEREGAGLRRAPLPPTVAGDLYPKTASPA